MNAKAQYEFLQFIDMIEWPEFSCTLCKVNISGENNVSQHLLSKAHKAVFKANFHGTKTYEKLQDEPGVICNICGAIISCDTEKEQETLMKFHVLSKSHSALLKALLKTVFTNLQNSRVQMHEESRENEERSVLHADPLFYMLAPEKVVKYRKIQLGSYYKHDRVRKTVHCEICEVDLERITVFQHTVGMRHKYNVMFIQFVQNGSQREGTDFIVLDIDKLQCKFCNGFTMYGGNENLLQEHVSSYEHMEKKASWLISNGSDPEDVRKMVEYAPQAGDNNIESDAEKSEDESDYASRRNVKKSGVREAANIQRFELLNDNISSSDASSLDDDQQNTVFEAVRSTDKQAGQFENISEHEMHVQNADTMRSGIRNFAGTESGNTEARLDANEHRVFLEIMDSERDGKLMQRIVCMICNKVILKSNMSTHCGTRGHTSKFCNVENRVDIPRVHRDETEAYYNIWPEYIFFLQNDPRLVCSLCLKVIPTEHMNHHLKEKKHLKKLNSTKKEANNPGSFSHEIAATESTREMHLHVAEVSNVQSEGSSLDEQESENIETPLDANAGQMFSKIVNSTANIQRYELLNDNLPSSDASGLDNDRQNTVLEVVRSTDRQAGQFENMLEQTVHLQNADSPNFAIQSLGNIHVQLPSCCASKEMRCPMRNIAKISIGSNDEFLKTFLRGIKVRNLISILRSSKNVNSRDYWDENTVCCEENEISLDANADKVFLEIINPSEKLKGKVVCIACNRIILRSSISRHSLGIRHCAKLRDPNDVANAHDADGDKNEFNSDCWPNYIFFVKNDRRLVCSLCKAVCTVEMNVHLQSKKHLEKLAEFEKETGNPDAFTHQIASTKSTQEIKSFDGEFQSMEGNGGPNIITKVMPSDAVSKMFNQDHLDHAEPSCSMSEKNADELAEASIGKLKLKYREGEAECAETRVGEFEKTSEQKMQLRSADDGKESENIEASHDANADHIYLEIINPDDKLKNSIVCTVCNRVLMRSHMSAHRLTRPHARKLISWITLGRIPNIQRKPSEICSDSWPDYVFFIENDSRLVCSLCLKAVPQQEMNNHMKMKKHVKKLANIEKETGNPGSSSRQIESTECTQEMNLHSAIVSQMRSETCSHNGEVSEIIEEPLAANGKLVYF